MTKDEALDKALEALERYVNEDDICEGMPGNEPWVETKYMGEAAITAIKQARSAPVQEPVGSEFLQAITDPENQPSQFGTVTLEYHFEKIKKWEELFERMSNKVLAQPAPVQEPVAWMRIKDITELTDSEPEEDGYTPLYTTPPAAQRQWVTFPTMLRKMWSGSEVQAWLDENVNKENT
jgi:hypothetical protein